MSAAVPTKLANKQARSKRRPAAVELLEAWSRERAYDTRAWPRVRRALAQNRLSRRAALND